MPNLLVLYAQEFDLDNLKKIWGQIQVTFHDHHVTAEFFNVNIFSPVKDLKAVSLEDLISCRFFDGNRQIKIRQIKDGIFWAVADFQPGGFVSLQDQEAIPAPERSVFLWGTFNEDIGHIFEERIPYLFSPALIAPQDKLGKEDRLSVKVVEFKDSHGNILWDRFLKI